MPAPSQRTRSHAVDPISVMRLLAGMAAVLFLAFTFADTDLWGHVRFGEDILDDRSIASHDPYSFTTDRPWVNHEWLAEVLMGAAYRAAGATGLVVLKLAVVVGTLLLVSKALRRVPWRAVDHDALIALTIIASYQRVYPLRPQVFSVFLFAGLLYALTAADRGDKRLLLVVPPALAIWANLHGAWLVGLGMLSIWVLVRLVWRNPGGVERRWLSLLWVASVAATLVNPYGTGLWSFLHETVGASRPGIADWQPLLEIAPILIMPTAVVAVVALAALAKARRAADPAYVLIVVATAIGTLRINRFDAFFTLAVVMLLAPYLGRARAASTAGSAPGSAPVWRRPLGIAAALALAAVAVFAGGSQARCITVRGEPEPEAVVFLRDHAPRARVLTYFDWGEYAIWHLAPGLKVSMDGRRETVYSDALFQAHLRLYHDEPGATRLVRRLAPDLIWLPADLPVLRRLKREGWKPVFRGPTSVILGSGAGRSAVVMAHGHPPKRCFPEA